MAVTTRTPVFTSVTGPDKNFVAGYIVPHASNTLAYRVECGFRPARVVMYAPLDEGGIAPSIRESYDSVGEYTLLWEDVDGVEQFVPRFIASIDSPCISIGSWGYNFSAGDDGGAGFWATEDTMAIGRYRLYFVAYRF